MGYLNKSFLSEIPIDRLEWYGLEIEVSKGHAQKCAQKITLAVYQLFVKFGPSPHNVETSSPFNFVQKTSELYQMILIPLIISLEHCRDS
jgi:hypothetical protein